MFFDYATFLTHITRALFRTRGTPRRLSLGRFRFFAIFALLFPFCQITTWIGFALDYILFPGFRRVDLRSRTLFIVGNFRSGSTFLHRLLSEDGSRFTALASWEIYAAPSVVQRKFYRGLRIVDSFFGSPLYRRVQRWDRRGLQKIPFHSVSVWKPEEDVGLLFYCWYSLFSWFFFPDWEQARKLVDFKSLPTPTRRRIVRFYSECIKRHLYAHDPDLIFVSKNPSFTPMIDDLSRYIPDSRFVALIRHPIDTYVSTLGWLNFAWNVFADPIERYSFVEEVAEMVVRWFDVLATIPEEIRCRLLRFDSLVDSPLGSIETIYQFVGSKLSLSRRVKLEVTELEAGTRLGTRSGTRSGSHSPDNISKVDEMGLDRRWLIDRFRDTIIKYGFELETE